MTTPPVPGLSELSAEQCGVIIPTAPSAVILTSTVPQSAVLWNQLLQLTLRSGLYQGAWEQSREGASLYAAWLYDLERSLRRLENATGSRTGINAHPFPWSQFDRWIGSPSPLVAVALIGGRMEWRSNRRQFQGGDMGRNEANSGKPLATDSSRSPFHSLHPLTMPATTPLAWMDSRFSQDFTKRHELAESCPAHYCYRESRSPKSNPATQPPIDKSPSDAPGSSPSAIEPQQPAPSAAMPRLEATPAEYAYAGNNPDLVARYLMKLGHTGKQSITRAKLSCSQLPAGTPLAELVAHAAQLTL